jgi:hypothetical protein
MHRLLVIVALLFALVGVASPMAASAAAMATVQVTSTDSSESCLVPVAQLTKTATLKPCGKKVNSKAVMSCHLPPMIIPAAVMPSLSCGAVTIEASIQAISLSQVFAGHFRPPRPADA